MFKENTVFKIKSKESDYGIPENISPDSADTAYSLSA